jgi:leucyl aminopeptidase
MYDKLSVGSARLAVSVRLITSECRDPKPARSSGSRDPGQALPPGFKGEVGEVSVVSDRSILLGMGRPEDLKPATVRIAGSRLVRALERLEFAAATLTGFEVLPRTGQAPGSPAATAQCLGEGMAIGQWRFGAFPGSASNRPPNRRQLLLSASSQAARQGLARGLLIGQAVNEARRLSAMPPNVCTPAWFAGESRRLARRHRLRCRVISAAEAKRLGMGGLCAVGKGSAAPPCLVLLEHRPSEVTAAASGRRLALVGKTITYDTGGYSLKVGNGMRGMKYDKCGGTAVLGAMLAIADAHLPIEVVAVLPAAENMVSGASYRPDDILTMHNGITVEVTNTDAEGRLVLGDALSYACRALRPSTIVDMATLTGGVVVALGTFSAGCFCNDEALRARLEGAAARTGERLWQLPLWPEHREFMRSQHADIINSNPKREAHPIQAAAFLSYFVDPTIPWAHLDIAGVNALEGPNDLMVAGPTGWGVRLLFDLAEGMTR